MCFPFIISGLFPKQESGKYNDVQDALIFILLDDNHEDKDYANSEFNPLMDPNILETLSEYGITII